MVTMSAIWDRTAEVLRGRGSMLAGIAALLLFLPTVAQDAASAYGGGSPGAIATVGLLRIIVAVAAIWANLAMVAGASDPLVDRASAFAIGVRRLPLAIALVALILVGLLLLFIPAGAMLVGSGIDFAALAAGASADVAATGSPGLVLGAGFYMLLLGVALLWLGARLSLLWPVLVNERFGFGSVARSFALTRGLTWRIVGVSILFAVLLLVALGAAQLVTSVAVRLVLGAGGAATARFAGAVAVALVSAAGGVVSATFVAQLYRVVSGREAAHALS